MRLQDYCYTSSINVNTYMLSLSCRNYSIASWESLFHLLCKLEQSTWPWLDAVSYINKSQKKCRQVDPWHYLRMSLTTPCLPSMAATIKPVLPSESSSWQSKLFSSSKSSTYLDFINKWNWLIMWIRWNESSRWQSKLFSSNDNFTFSPFWHVYWKHLFWLHFGFCEQVEEQDFDLFVGWFSIVMLMSYVASRAA